eukprot:253828_1
MMAAALTTILLAAFYAVTAALDGYVETPHGLRLAQCVHTATESPARITKILNVTHDGVLVSYPLSGNNVFYPKLPECLEDLKRLQEGKANHNWQQVLKQQNTPAMGTFAADYTLPDENPKNEGQHLMFFTGMTNHNKHGVNGWMIDNETTILQPVVRFISGNGWSMAAWNCCPDGQTHEGKIIALPQNAKSIKTFMTANKTDIYCTMEYDGKSSSLTQPAIGRIYTQVEVVLEQVDTTDCDGYNKIAFNVTNIKIKTLNGENFSPKWEKIENNTCHGGIKLYNEFNVGIWGADEPK